MKQLFFLAVMFFFAVPASAAEPPALRIVCLGDSITQGRGDNSGGGAKWTRLSAIATHFISTSWSLLVPSYIPGEPDQLTLPQLDHFHNWLVSLVII